MASKALGDLTAASALSGAEEVYIVQSGNSRKSTAQAIADLGTSQDNMTDGTTNKNYTATEQTRLANTSGTNTGDQTMITGNAGTATKLATARNIDGQSFDGTADVTIMAPGTHAAASKATPVDADEFPLVDSAASFGLKKLTWANFKTTLKAYFDPLYYRAGNILGTVSQSAGVPTGAVIETGSNANGSYVRYADGTQICLGRKNTAIPINVTSSSSPGGYRSDPIIFTFPSAFATGTVPFVSPYPTGITGGNGGAVAMSNTAPSSTSYSFYLAAAISSATADAGYIAIGRWF